AEPVKQHTPAPARLYKASLSRTPETPAAQLSKVQAGHDETLGEGVKVKEAVGLLGQKGSPIAATTKVAALTRTGQHRSRNLE
ncbi:MAG: hypothetical protein ACE5FM_07310, partial [Methyloligellaceae bacterium]